MLSSPVQLFLCFTLYISAVLSFSVNIGSSPTQCGPLSITWTGGQAPFQILLTPVFGIPRNISVPSTAFDNNLGSYQISALPFTNDTTFLLTMSDATGFGTGGTSDLLTVGAPVSGASCNTTDPSLPFSFSLPNALQQCNPYVFNGYDEATLPVTFMGLIPGGQSFLLHSTSTSLTWVADVAAGTTIIFSLFDARGRTGGSSDTETVALSNDASCLDASSPSSTISSAPSSTSTSGSPSSMRSYSTVSTGTIVGAACGVILAVIAIVALAVFYLKRSRHRRSPYGLASARNSGRLNSVELETDNFQQPQIYPFPYQTDSVTRPMIPSSSAIPAPHQETSSIGASDRASEAPTPYTQQHSRTPSHNDSFAVYGDIASSSMSSSGRRKAAMAGLTSYKPVARFIVHTDAEDDPPESEAEIIELPPQYSERTPAATCTGEETTLEVTGSASHRASLSRQNVEDLSQDALHPPP